MRFQSLIFIAIILSVAVVSDAKRITADECKVCVDVISGINEQITDDDKKSLEKIESKITKYCKQKSLTPEQKKICYHIDPIKREVSRPLSFGMPADDICIRKLNKKNPEFCSVRYNADKPAPEEVATMNPSKMRISQLKAYLAEHGAKCVGCYEKGDYVRKVREIMNAEL